jgi:lipase chaperone LimK
MKRHSGVRRVLVAAIVILGMLLLSRSFQNSAAESSPAPDISEQGAMTEPVQAELQPVFADEQPTPAPHPSLAGTDVNGGLRVDNQGRIVLHRDLRRLFDYYLSLRGRMEAEAIRALLRQHLEAQHDAPVVIQAMELFDRYLGLIDAETKLTEEWTARDLNVSNQVEEILAERRHLRREQLGDAMAEAFYQDQEQYEAYQLERMKISTNPQLTAEQKKAELEAAEAMLTPEQREIRRQTFAWLDIKSHTRQSTAALDADAAEAIRQRFGDEALDRLAIAEEEQKSWEQKRAAWLAEKSRLAARTDLTEAEKKDFLLEFGRSQLDPADLRRMLALDSEAAGH